MMGAWHTNALEGTGAVPHTLVGRRTNATAEFARTRGFTTLDDLARGGARRRCDRCRHPGDAERDPCRLGAPRARERQARARRDPARHEPCTTPSGRSRRRPHVGLTLGVVHPLRARPELDRLRQRVESGSRARPPGGRTAVPPPARERRLDRLPAQLDGQHSLAPYGAPCRCRPLGVRRRRGRR